MSRELKDLKSDMHSADLQPYQGDAAFTSSKRTLDNGVVSSVSLVWARQHTTLSQNIPRRLQQAEDALDIPHNLLRGSYVVGQHQMEEETYSENQIRKRLRLCSHDHSVDPISAGTASTACVGRNFEHSVGQQPVRKQRQPNDEQPVEWWKQRRPRPKSNVDNESLCHVCQNSYAINQNESLGTVSAATNNKTLLSYFVPISRLTRSSSNHVRTMDVTMHDRQTSIQIATDCVCTFCERSDICPNCVQTCEDCLLQFCLFCITADDCSRPVCLDCAATKSKLFLDDDDDTAMELD